MTLKPVYPPKSIVMRDKVHPVSWCIPWMLLTVEEVIQHEEGANIMILFDRAQAENLFAVGSLVRESIARTPNGDDLCHRLWKRVKDDELVTLGRHLMPQVAPGLCVARPSLSPSLTKPKILIQQAYDEYQALEVPEDRDWNIFPELKIQKVAQTGFSALGDAVVTLIKELYERRPVENLTIDVNCALTTLIERGLRNLPGVTAVIDVSDVENWLKYDHKWKMPDCMQLPSYRKRPELSEKAWNDYFFKLSVADLGASTQW